VCAATAAGTVWLIAAAGTGVWGWPLALLWAGGYALALPHWRRHHIPTPSARPLELLPPAPEPDERKAPDWDPAVVWAERIGAKGRILDGSKLLGREQMPTGWSWTIQLDSGRQSTETALAASPIVASGLTLPMDRVTVDRHPSGDMDKAHLLITDPGSNPLRQLHPYPGPDKAFDVTTGTALTGVYADLEHATFQVYDKTGAKRGVVIGASRSGKSRYLELLAASCMHSGRVLVWFADGQRGASSPMLAKYADWFAGDPDEALIMFRTAVALIRRRAQLGRLFGRNEHPIVPEAPMVLLIADECHVLFTQGSELGQYGEDVARTGGKGGVGLIAASQYPGVPSFAGSPGFRNELATAASVVLRTGGSGNSGMLPTLGSLDPSQLPNIPGIGYTAGNEARTAPFRGFYEEEAIVDRLLATAPKIGLEKAVLGYLGPDYLERHDRAADDLGDLASEIARDDPDMIAALAARDPAIAAALQRLQTRTRRPATSAGPAPAEASRPTATVIPLIPPAPRFAPPDEDEPAAAAPTAPAAAQLPAVLRTPAGRRVHELLGQGVTRPADLAAQSGAGKSRVHEVLNDLAAAGLVVSGGHGIWIPTDTDRSATPS
jgi:hypothetical protein